MLAGLESEPEEDELHSYLILMEETEEAEMEYRSLLKSGMGRTQDNEIEEALFLKHDGSPIKQRMQAPEGTSEDSKPKPLL